MTVVKPSPGSIKVIRGVDTPRTPPVEVQDAIEAGTTRITRRVEIWQADDNGVESPWNPDESGIATLRRLVTGSINLSYGTEQRRGLDLTLENSDGALRPHYDGLWYDKFIKVFRGIKYETSADSARICIVDAKDSTEAIRFAGVLGTLGYYRVTYEESKPTFDHEIFATYTGELAHQKTQFLKAAYNSGKSVLTVGTGNGPTEVPQIATVSGVQSAEMLPDTSAESAVTYGGTSIVITRDNSWAVKGSYSWRLTPNNATNVDTFMHMLGDTGALRVGMQGGKTYRVKGTCRVPVTLTGSLDTRHARIVVYYKVGTAGYVQMVSKTGILSAAGVTEHSLDFTIPAGATEAFIRFYNGATSSAANLVQWDDISLKEIRGTGTWGVRQPVRDTPFSGAFGTGPVAGTALGNRPTSLAAGAIPVALWTDGSLIDYVTASYTENAVGGRWLNIQLPSITGGEPRKLLEAGLLWLQRYEPYKTWEIQMGEFAIDGINDQTFPDQVKVTGRDYSKLCMNSKLSQQTTYSKGMNASDLIRSLGYQSGIRKDRVQQINAVLKDDLSYEPETPRWTIMTAIANSHGYDVFFDNEGYLTLDRWQDPVTSAPVWIFETGKQGNLVSLDRSVNDAEILNHIAVYSSNPSGEMPFFGEAKNTDPQSPTRIAKVGTRFKKFDFDDCTSNEECRLRAVELVKIYGLESFSLNFSSIYYPWFDVGDIITILDPNRRDDEPTRYLLDTLTHAIDLGPMSGTAKRISYVGEANEQ